VVGSTSPREFYITQALNVYKQKTRQRRVFIVAGAGFEPATSGLWASRIFFNFKLAGRQYSVKLFPQI